MCMWSLESVKIIIYIGKTFPEMVYFERGSRLRPSMALPDLSKLSSIQHGSVSKILPPITKVVFVAMPVLLFLYKEIVVTWNLSPNDLFCFKWLFYYYIVFVHHIKLFLWLCVSASSEATPSWSHIERSWGDRNSVGLNLCETETVCWTLRCQISDSGEPNLVYGKFVFFFFLALFSLCSTRYSPDCWLQCIEWWIIK